MFRYTYLIWSNCVIISKGYDLPLIRNVINTLLIKTLLAYVLPILIGCIIGRITAHSLLTPMIAHSGIGLLIRHILYDLNENDSDMYQLHNLLTLVIDNFLSAFIDAWLTFVITFLIRDIIIGIIDHIIAHSLLTPMITDSLFMCLKVGITVDIIGGMIGGMIDNITRLFRVGITADRLLILFAAGCSLLPTIIGIIGGIIADRSIFPSLTDRSIFPSLTDRSIFPSLSGIITGIIVGLIADSLLESRIGRIFPGRRRKMIVLGILALSIQYTIKD